MAEDRGTLSGLTASEAQEFHKLFMMGFLVFTGVAIVAHFLVWSWRPWFPGEGGYSMIDGVNSALANLSALIA